MKKMSKSQIEKYAVGYPYPTDFVETVLEGCNYDKEKAHEILCNENVSGAGVSFPNTAVNNIKEQIIKNTSLFDMGDRLTHCPFCKRGFTFCKNTYTNKYGKKSTQQYYIHKGNDINDCILEDITNGFIIGAGDANEETGYLGEYALKWNEQLKNTSSR